jgi:hypothetical protein
MRQGLFEFAERETFPGERVAIADRVDERQFACRD